MFSHFSEAMAALAAVETSLEEAEEEKRNLGENVPGEIFKSFVFRDPNTPEPRYKVHGNKVFFPIIKDRCEKK